MAEDYRDELWRAELADALAASPMTQADLARAIGRKQQQVSDWMAGRAKVPRPDVVFAIEDALGCPDLLSQILGYVRAGAVDTERAINRDESLGQQERGLLVDLYRRLRG